MTVRSFGKKRPTLGDRAWVDEDAVVIGDVRLGEDVTIWPGAVLRADDDHISVGRGSAFMDLSFAESPWGRPVTVGEGCIVSHGARLHGCTIGGGVLIGIGAIVLDGARVGERSVIAAGALISTGTAVPPGSVVMGVPGKVVRETGRQDAEWLEAELKAIRKKSEIYREK